jgi:hypothetical protein
VDIDAEASAGLPVTASLIYSFRHSDELYIGTDRVPNPTGLESYYHAALLRLVWDVNQKWGLSGNVLWEWSRTEQFGNTIYDDEGFSDTRILVRWTPWAEKKDKWMQRLSLFGGFDAPTGSANRRPLLVLTDPDAYISRQHGAGVWAAVGGIHYRHSLAEKLTLEASLFGTFPSGTANSGIDPGDSGSLFVRLNWLANDKWKFGAGLQGIARSHDNLDGMRMGNTGGWELWAVPSVAYRLSNRAALEVAAFLPCAYDVRSRQLVPGPLFQFTASFEF